MYESPRKKGRPLTENERNLISHLLRLGHTQTDIAKVIGVYPSTICRELRRGEVELLNSDKWIYYKTYSPQKAQMQADYMKTAHGPDLKIGNRRDYLAALEAYMLTGNIESWRRLRHPYKQDDLLPLHKNASFPIPAL